jgi:hypothetical protein
MKSPILPVVKPLILCEDVIHDPGTDNIHLVGMFTRIRPRASPPFPYRMPRFCVFVQLSDAQGVLPGWIEIEEASSQRTVMRTASHPLAFPDRRSIQRFLFRIEQCPFPRPGVYWVQFYCDGTLLADHVLNLVGPGYNDAG